MIVNVALLVASNGIFNTGGAIAESSTPLETMLLCPFKRFKNDKEPINVGNPQVTRIANSTTLPITVAISLFLALASVWRSERGL